MTETPDEPRVLPELDTPPRDDYWAPEINEIALTEDEIAAGNALGDENRPEDVA